MSLEEWLKSQLHEFSAKKQLRAPRASFSAEMNCLKRNWATNDYLGLSSDPRLIAAANRATTESGTGARASPLICGRTAWHDELEHALARFKQTEAALLFPSGFAANVGVFSALVQPEDVVFCDRLNHASLVDGCRLSGARLRVYRHDDLDVLRRELQKSEPSSRRWIVTDSVFSMDGDLAPLGELCDLAETYGAEIILDEAHATGVFGTSGRGVAEACGVEERIAVSIGTLSKSIGSAGGFVCGSRLLIDYLFNSARSQMYSTALPPGCCATALAALEVIRLEPERRAKLLINALEFKRALCGEGLTGFEKSEGPIIPVIVREEAVAMQAQHHLLEHGWFVAAIRPPTVPHGTSRLRISLTYNLADDLTLWKNFSRDLRDALL